MHVSVHSVAPLVTTDEHEGHGGDGLAEGESVEEKALGEVDVVPWDLGLGVKVRGGSALVCWDGGKSDSHRAEAEWDCGRAFAC